MKFLKETDPVKDVEARSVAIFAGEMMMDGSKLVRRVIFMRVKAQQSAQHNFEDVQTSFSNLSDDAKHSLRKLLASSLIISSLQSVFFGKLYRSIIILGFEKGEKEVNQPERIADRIKRFGAYSPQLGQTPS